MDGAKALVAASGRIKQRRSQKTFDALISAAFKLLEEREFGEISVADLVREAGYSVGAFYARFKSKDELLEAMVLRHIEGRRTARASFFAVVDDDRLVHDLMQETVDYYWKRRRFWRAALFRSIRDPDFWAPVRKLGHEVADSMIARMSERANRALTTAEQTNVRFAVQLMLASINNAIVNRPGPILIGETEFVESLERAFRLVSDYDVVLGLKDSPPKFAPARAQTSR